jgi:hypothetical protein
MAGAVTGTGALARGTRFLATRAPGAARLLGGQGGSQFARNVATDVGYSGIYGANTTGDPLTSSVLGAGGSVAGQGIGKALGSVVTGLKINPQAQALGDRGVPLTIGQQIGGFAKSAEDALTSVPIAGDMVNARRLEGLQAFNREALGEAGAPIGFTPTDIGKGGIDQLSGAAGRAYDSATSGTRVAFDPQFMTDFAQFGAAAQTLPRDLRVRAARAIENRVAPLTDAGEMTGEQYQQAFRGLKGYKAETSKPGFEQDYRDALSLAQDALTQQMQRGGGRNVVDGLRNADRAYRNITIVGDAASRADGANYVFTPSQLQDAVKFAQRRFPGATPLSELADTGQAVLPSKLPDSGTARRVIQNTILGGAALGGAGGVDYASDGDSNALRNTALTTALLALGGTKAGQKVLQKSLLDRPGKAQALGRAIKARQGLFGSAALPLLIAD